MDLTMAVPQIDPQEFEEMLNSNMKVSITYELRHEKTNNLHLYIDVLLEILVQ